MDDDGLISFFGSGRFRHQKYTEGFCDRHIDFMVTCLPRAKVVNITRRLDRKIDSAGEELAQQSWCTLAPVTLGKVADQSWKKLSYWAEC